jgi:rubrerythrin
MSIDRILATSARLQTEDLDWEAAGRAGLSARERQVLGYFADIESQTIMYLRDLLGSEVAAEPEVVGFLSAWNYEEYFHGEALARLLAECGCPLPRDRIDRVRRGAAFLESLQALLGGLASRLLTREFPALYMAWGASQELTTLRGYEELERGTRNPILRELCRRIARQERRHFAWYYHSARTRLSASPRAQRLTRLAFRHLWAPVGAAVKGRRAALELAGHLFPGARAAEVAREVERRIGALPGLGGTEFFSRFLFRGSGSPALAEDPQPG